MLFASEPSVAIWHDHFQAMVTIRAGDETIFDGSCPLFFMASEGLALIKELPDTRSEDLYIPERSGIRLSLVDGDRVAIEDSATGRRGIADYDELRDAWSAFF
jgi:hypothetical protein